MRIASSSKTLVTVQRTVGYDRLTFCQAVCSSSALRSTSEAGGEFAAATRSTDAPTSDRVFSIGPTRYHRICVTYEADEHRLVPSPCACSKFSSHWQR